MIFRQLFDHNSYTYTYLIACKKSREAIFIDPVSSHIDAYLQLISELELKLKFAIDTHIHADHITAIGNLQKKTSCISAMGERSKAKNLKAHLQDGEYLKIGDIKLKVLHTPGHTDDSYSFYTEGKVFTGDTLLIRGTGRTDFQNGSASAQYDSIFNKVLKLPNSTTVYPSHDYKGWTSSTIGEEKKHNPRLKVSSKKEYIDLMNNLNISQPKLIDIAVPANLNCGLTKN